MYKKALILFLVCIMVFSFAACSNDTDAPAETETEENAAAAEEEVEDVKDYKIGLVTPAISVSEDEFRGGERVVEKYPDIVKHLVLPENFTAEQETAIAQITSLADDESVKAIVIATGYSGILPAVQKVKEVRPDMIVITAPIWDDPDAMANYIDLCLDTDWLRRGDTIAQKAYDMGAKTYIHYSFPTHMSKELIANRHGKMKETAERLGMEFVELMTPDPHGGDSYSAMVQFLNEDIPRQIDKYGEDTNIFGTNCSMQDVIIAKALELGYIMAEQCCPTPTQGFPAAMGLEIGPEEAGDFDVINEMIKQKAAEAGATGRLSTWPIAVGYFLPEFAVEVAIRMVEGEVEVADLSQELLEEIGEEVAGVSVYFNKMKPELDNYFLMIMDSIFY
ncbi:DUF3798 domain-containing protein [Candidatus Contubernalis alkaliaceticus]|uniref:DUF3798 domain-containing protein n=1 Tax=Candidatus Contubernalis alkaliaceticus TaxID=338645 RepID=UPI001F4C4E7A|nr:DUF3798 domain-containing protein [Candidatus Contubernalis alkalaceticus]UNC90856.1 DUF3798 domain-containing protein [Candidatus Contubernalis alkalaceticus]